MVPKTETMHRKYSIGNAGRRAMSRTGFKIAIPVAVSGRDGSVTIIGCCKTSDRPTQDDQEEVC